MPNNSLDELVEPLIKTGRYNAEKNVKMFRDQPADYTIYKCNLFVDDVSKSKGIVLPRLYDLNPAEEKFWPGWGHRPARAKDLRYFLRAADRTKNSGVIMVKRDRASELANDNHLVLAIAKSGIHSTIMAPSSDVPRVYRQDQTDRDEYKTKVTVGTGYDFFYIEPSTYRRWVEGGLEGTSPYEWRQRGTMIDKMEGI
jgi:hypothetical protein